MLYELRKKIKRNTNNDIKPQPCSQLLLNRQYHRGNINSWVLCDLVEDVLEGGSQRLVPPTVC
jgi:hypothetical protein